MRALVIDDDKHRCTTIRSSLEKCGFRVEFEEKTQGKIGYGAFEKHIKSMERAPDLAIIDYSLRWEDSDGNPYDGDSVAALLREQWAGDLPFYILFISAFFQTLDSSSRYETLVDLLQTPYTGFLELSPGWESRLEDHVNAASGLVRNAKSNAIGSLDLELAERFFPKGFVGKAPSLLAITEKAKRASARDISVLITGETGTGKELLAEAIHKNSSRKEGPFIPVNVGNLKGDLLESKLFGHEKGAFTGATGRHIGCFEQATGGILFLDEIGDIPEETQTRMLRALESGVITRLGGQEEIRINVRIVSATNKNMRELAKTRNVRPDFYFRISQFPVQMPPLRDRGNDVLDLADAFLINFSREEGGEDLDFSDSARRWLRDQQWPGNIRQLMNLVRRAAIEREGDIIDTELLKRLHAEDDLDQESDVRTDDGMNWEQRWLGFLDDARLWYFGKWYQKCGGNQISMSEGTGLSREHVNKTLKKLGIT